MHAWDATRSQTTTTAQILLPMIPSHLLHLHLHLLISLQPWWTKPRTLFFRLTNAETLELGLRAPVIT